MEKKITKELMAASAVPIILSTLLNGDNYGYEIVQEIKKLTDRKTPWQEASIYPVLKKLEKQGMIISYWRMTPDERHRKYYIIQEAGKEELKNMIEQWKYIYKIIQNLENTNKEKTR